MKFARYLQDTQTPEWKKAYIDYRTLKKRITAIRKAQEGLSSSESEPGSPGEEERRSRPSDESHKDHHHDQDKLGLPDPVLLDAIPKQDLKQSSQGVPPIHLTTPTHEKHTRISEEPPRVSASGSRSGGSFDSVHTPPSQNQNQNTKQQSPRNGRRPSFVTSIRRGLGIEETSIREEAEEEVEEGAQGDSESAGAEHDRVTKPKPSPTRTRRSSTAYVRSLASFRLGTARSTINNDIFNRTGTLPSTPYPRLPLSALLPQLTPPERAFFTALDAQFDKIEAFYVARESEMAARTRMLREQLEELGDHKKIVQAAHPGPTSTWSTALKAKLKRTRVLHPGAVHRNGETVVTSPTSDDTLPPLSPGSGSKGKQPGSAEVKLATIKIEGKDGSEDEKHVQAQPGRHAVRLSSDPEDYLYAKKKLKKAVLEHYRGLEVLHNYRILNLTGFKKALKKFEKITKIKAQQQYMSEKVEQSAFASDKNVREMMHALEALYATRFAKGDKKRAVTRLRAGFSAKSHHYSVFRSGILLGLAVPALVSGIYSSFQQSTRDAISGWDALLIVYGVMLVPVLFSILVGSNLLVWARARINYVFIFELDTRTRMDYREYFEIPSILLATLAYAFFLSFVAHNVASPTLWPLVWLGICGLLMLDPLPLLYKPSRYWLLGSTGKLLLSGTRRVEFTDFWMGDQFCSLVYSLSNLYFFACVYARGFGDDWGRCSVTGSPQWPVPFVLASLPLLFRLVQSVKRYCDSGLVTHLINGGKYGSGIVSNLFFYLWRHQGTTRHGTIFALWVLFNTLYSVYASSWDFLMDWSVLRMRARYPLLRAELVYSDSIPLYYIAIVTNLLIRFIWVIYIPSSTLNINVRAFIAAVLEILRRWQWNFFRLENEHLGNMDQYRVTREVPLPYSFDDTRVEDTQDDDDDDEALQIAAARMQATRRARLRRRVGWRSKKTP